MTVYNIFSPELKQILFADEAKRGVNVAESNCIVEVDNKGNERKSLVVSGGEVNITPPVFLNLSRNYDYSSQFGSLSEPQLVIKPFLDNVRIPTYDESGRLLIDPIEIEEEVEKRRNGQRKGDYWKKEWSQIGKVKSVPSSSRIEEIDTQTIPLIRDNQDVKEVEKQKKEIEDNYKKSLVDAERYKRQLEEWEARQVSDPYLKK